MSDPKLHYYVPQFHLRRFMDDDDRLWVWDRDRDRVFSTGPKRVAAENNFYFLDDFVPEGHDPFTMEKQLASLESEVSRITNQWTHWLREVEPGEAIPVPEINRELVSLYLALQFFRTKDARSILKAFAEEKLGYDFSDPDEDRKLHTTALWHEPLTQGLRDRLRGCAWIFGRNDSSTPFITSDNPLAFRTGDNSMWLKAGFYSEGTYAVFPLTPDLIMYCHPREGRWKNLSIFDLCRSPASFTAEMVESENTGQVFMASRFVFSCRPHFDVEREFAPTIGTDLYAEEGVEKARRHGGK